MEFPEGVRSMVMPLVCSIGAVRDEEELLEMIIGAGGDHIICLEGEHRDKRCGSLCGPLRVLDSGRPPCP